MKLKDLAKFVSEKEKKIAQEKETCILSDFVSDFGELAEAQKSEIEIADADAKYWIGAYTDLERCQCLSP